MNLSPEVALRLSRVIVAALLTTATVSAMGQNPQRAYEPNTVAVSASGRYEADPDVAVLTVRLSDQRKTQSEAYSNVTEGAEQFRNVLKQHGLDAKAARVSSFQVQPVIDWNSAKQKTIAYTVSTTAELKLTDFTKAGDLLTSLAQIPTAVDQSLRYELQDESAAKQKAIQDAYRHAEQEATTVATASHRQLGQLVYASVDTQFEQPPIPMYSRKTLEMNAGVAPPTQDLGEQKQVVTAHISAVYALQ